MVISEETHNALTRVELLALIAACEQCECDFNCYCASNIEWAERQLEKLKRRTQLSPRQDGPSVTKERNDAT